MQREVHHISIEKNSSSELLRVAREVQRSGIPAIIHADGEEIAQVTPTVPKKRRSRPKGLRFEEGCNDWLLSMKGLITSDDGPMDVGIRHDDYLAQAYFEELQPPKRP